MYKCGKQIEKTLRARAQTDGGAACRTSEQEDEYWIAHFSATARLAAAEPLGTARAPATASIDLQYDANIMI